MKGDRRVAAKCPLCPKVVRPGQRRIENGYVKTNTTAGILSNAMRQHFIRDHPELKVREMNDLLARFRRALETTQTQIVDPSPQPTALLPCPVPGCPTVLQTWLEDVRGQYLSPHGVARHALRQHIYHKHPGFSARQVLEFLELAVFRPTEMRAEPSRPPQGQSADESTLPDLVAPARPGVPAHASGKVGEPRVLQAKKRSGTVVAVATTS